MSITMPDIFSSYRSIATKRDAVGLAGLLADPERERPVVVVSTTKNGPVINPAVLADHLGSDADVYLLKSASLAYDFQDEMPPDTSVYGGAARTYPPGTEWMRNTSRAMVRLAYTEAEGRIAIGQIADDVAASGGTHARTTSTPAPRREAASVIVEGEVSVLLEPDGVLVKLDDGIARIDTSVLAPGVHPERLFAPAQRVTGTVSNGMFTITDGLNTPASAADHAVAGGIFPALVTSPKAVSLFPGLSVRHASEEPEGAVVAVLVELSGRADGKAWKVSAVEDPAAVSDALPFLSGGEPWIRWEPSGEPQEAPEGPAPASAGTAAPGDAFAALDLVFDRLEALTADNERLTEERDALQSEIDAQEPTPTPSPVFGGAELERARQQIILLTQEKREMNTDHRRALADADDLAAENARLSHLNERLRDEIRTERARASRARQMAKDITDVTETGPLFNDPAEQFRHEVYVEWATRIPAGAKAENPLAAYGFVDGFLDAVNGLQGVDRSKIVAVAVEVLTGIADSMPGRDMHRLRGGATGGSGYIEHADYGNAWRVNLQTKTASARRLHFWRGTDGKIMFATVGVHDDMDI